MYNLNRQSLKFCHKRRILHELATGAEVDVFIGVR